MKHYSLITLYHEIPIKEVWWGVHKIMVDHNWTIVNVNFQKMSTRVEC